MPLMVKKVTVAFVQYQERSTHLTTKNAKNELFKGKKKVYNLAILPLLAKIKAHFYFYYSGAFRLRPI